MNAIVNFTGTGNFANNDLSLQYAVNNNSIQYVTNFVAQKTFCLLGMEKIRCESFPKNNYFPVISSFAFRDSNIQAYIDQIHTQYLPDINYNNTNFPKNFAHFINLGYYALDEGNLACHIPLETYNFKLCRESTEFLKNIEEKFKETEKDMARQAFHYNGHKFTFYQKNREINALIGINPQIQINYDEAIKNIESFILQNPYFFDFSENDIIDFFQYLNYILMKDLPETIINAQYGKIRNQDVFYIRFKDNESSSKFINDQIDSILSNPEERRIYTENFANYNVKQNVNNLCKEMREFERVLWKKIGFCGLNAQFVDKEFYNFVHKLKLYSKQNIHPVAFAAWVHSEILRIFPFYDGNGRFARLLMNTILIRYRYAPLMFPSKPEYIEAVLENETNPGYFAKYLNQEIIPLNKKYANYYFNLNSSGVKDDKVVN